MQSSKSSFLGQTFFSSGDAVVSWLVRSSPGRAVRVRALAADTVLCSWARHLTLTVPLYTQVYKWVPAICWGNLTNCGEVTCDGLASPPGGVEILLVALCYRNRDKLRQLQTRYGSKTSLFLACGCSSHCLFLPARRLERDSPYSVVDFVGSKIVI